MSAAEIHKWLRLSSEQRQGVIHTIYKTNDPNLTHESLLLVKAPQRSGIFASMGPRYQFAIFGRDSIEVAEDVLALLPTLSKEIILVLARLQGMQFNMTNEEEPGKIHHEYRARFFGDREVPKAAQLVLDVLREKWGGGKDELIYFGSCDATPMFIRLVYHYCDRYGNEILDHLITGRDGRERTLREHVRLATIWLVDKITASPWQMLEYHRLNPVGLYNQSWEDSSISYLHVDGTLANSETGVAAIEIQGYAYDALRAAADLIALNSTRFL